MLWRPALLGLCLLLPASAPTPSSGEDPLPPAAISRMGTTRLRHPGYALSVAFSPDGETIASAGQGQVRLWDARTGRRIASLPETAHDTDSAADVRYSPDGRVLAVHTTGWLTLWDPRDRRIVRAIRGAGNVTRSAVAFSPDGALVAWAGHPASLSVYEVITGRELARLPAGEVVGSAAFLADGKAIVGTAGRAITLWDLATQRPTALAIGSVWYGSLDVAPDGALLAAGAEDGIHLWDLPSRRERPRLKLSFEEARSAVVRVALSPSRNMVASGTADGVVRLWDVGTGEARRLAERALQSVTGLSFSPDGRRLAAASWDGGIRIWDTTTGEPYLANPGHVYAVSSLAFSDDARQLASGGWDGTVRLWETETGRLLMSMPRQGSTVTSLAVSRATGTLMSGTWRDMHLWDLETGALRKKQYVHQGYVSAALFGDQRTFVTAGSQRTVLGLWALPDGTRLGELKGHRGTVDTVSVAADGSTILSGGQDGDVRVWHRVGPNPMDWRSSVFRGHERTRVRSWPEARSAVMVVGGGVLDTAVSANGLVAASTGSDGSLLLWNTRDRRVVKTIRPPDPDPQYTMRIGAIALSPDGKLVAWSFGFDYGKHVLVLDWQSGRQAFLPQEYVTVLAFSPDGRRLASGSKDSTTVVWDTGRIFAEATLAPGADPPLR